VLVTKVVRLLNVLVCNSIYLTLVYICGICEMVAVINIGSMLLVCHYLITMLLCWESGAALTHSLTQTSLACELLF